MEYKFYAVVKNLLSKAGGTGFIPGRGTWVCSLVRELTYRTPWGNEGCVLPLQRPTGLEPRLCSKRSHRTEKSVHCNWGGALLSATGESPSFLD